VVCLTETWLYNSIDNVTVQLNGYADPFRLDRNRHGGGVLAYVKNDIFCVRHFDYESDDVEMLWLELKTSNFRCLYIAMCYLPPNSYSRLKQKFTDSLSTVLASLLVDPDCCVLIIGDFSDHSVFKPIQLQLNLFRTLSAFGFHQFIDTATQNRVILDWALTNVPSTVLSHGVLDHINNLDHNPIFIELNFSLKHHVVSKPFFVWDYNNGDFLGLTMHCMLPLGNSLS